MKHTGHLSGVGHKSPKCCLCCNIKTGILFYGIFIAVGHIMFAGWLSYATIHCDVLAPQDEPQYNGVVLIHTENGSFFKHFGIDHVKQQITKDNLYLLFGVTLLGLVSTLALIYGIVKNIASYLMPFFCLQAFYFCLSCLVVVGCLKYIPNIKDWIRDQGLTHYPGMEYVMAIDSDYLLLPLVAILILILSVKAYLVCMVWSCYKHIQQLVMARTIDPDTESLLPPCYEDAMKVPSYYLQPPAYSQE